MTEPNLDPKPLPAALKPWEGSSSSVEQGRHWSSALIWLSAGLLGSALIWGFTAKVDQTISVSGELEPAGSVRDVDAPSSGVVSRVLVSDGDKVDQGEPLIEVEAAGIRSREQSVSTTISILETQNQSLQSLLDAGGASNPLASTPALPENLEPELRSRIATALQQTEQIKARLKQIDVQLDSKRKTLALKQRIEADLRPLYESGGFSRIQYLEQLNAIQEQTSIISSLIQERESVLGAIAGQINDNNRDLGGLRSEKISLRENLSYRTVRAPISGTVFNLQASPSSVVSTNQVLLKIVPSNRLQAQVAISNSDIGFVRTGLPVTVSVDSFPSGEFGYISGTLSAIGSDALPPDQTNGSARFPATIQLEQQRVQSGKLNLNLQSGMSVSANIKLRSRPVINLVSDLFTKQLEGVKQFR